MHFKISPRQHHSPHLPKKRPLPRFCTPLFGLLAGLCALSLCGCATILNWFDLRANQHNARGEEWLSDQTLPAEINISGSYHSPEWGDSFFYQIGRQVRGHLGDYPVKGVVSGRRAYLLVSDSGWYYYSAILQQPRPGVLFGYYSRSVPYRRDFRRDLQLYKK